MQSITLRPTPKSSIVESEELLGEELFLYDDVTGAVHTLSSGAAMVWLLCDGERDLGQIISEIQSVSHMPTDIISAQVEDTVNRFQNLGLLEG